MVNMFFYLFHRIYGLTKHWRPNRRPRQHTNYPLRRRPPPPPPPHPQAQSQSLPGANLRKRVHLDTMPTYCPFCNPVIKATHMDQQTGNHAKFFLLPGVDWCITTVNSSLMRRRVPKALLSFFCPTKPLIVDLTNPCMMSMRDSLSAPRQIKFDTDSQKFLIDSGAYAHQFWNRRKDFIYYRSLSPQERKNDQVLGLSGEAVSPQGIGSIRLRIEDDLNDIHTIHLHDVLFLPEAPINIFAFQVFSQQRQTEGDSKASCSISADSISLQWTGENSKHANKYVPLYKSNVGICFTASG